MAARGDNYITYTYRGGERHDIPLDATHVTVDASVRVILAEAFRGHPNIVEIVCHDKVETVERGAFSWCPCLRRVIMPGVEVVEREAFYNCPALTDVECGKLEIIESAAFKYCESLGSIDLLSAKIVEREAFYCCPALTEAKFGSKLERIEGEAFRFCAALERITIPLKDGIIAADDIFRWCHNLKHVDLVEAELHETIAALQLEEWRNDMSEEIDTINQILPTVVDAGHYDDDGEKAQAIRTLIRLVLNKIIHYQAEHRRLVNEEVATRLQLALPRDVVMNHVLPFLELPSYKFELVGDQEGDKEDEEEDEEEEEEEEGDDDYDNGRRDVTIWRRFCCC